MFTSALSVLKQKSGTTKMLLILSHRYKQKHPHAQKMVGMHMSTAQSVITQQRWIFLLPATQKKSSPQWQQPAHLQVLQKVRSAQFAAL